MCGIAGILHFDGRRVDEAILEKMVARLYHRGPDHTAMYINGGIGLGVRRLSIIDVYNGNQPVFNEDRSVVAVFNGEIYNHNQLRIQLEKQGHRFASLSDSEVLVHLYEEHGIDFLRYLNGMYAIALWDSAKQVLVLARDRMGQKPLLYAEVPNGIVFGSEIQAIAINKDVELAIDPMALDDYLTLLYVPAPKTIFRNIKKLRPGNFLTITAADTQQRRYWDVDFNTVENLDEREAVDATVNMINDAVKLHLGSDVPVGAFLSGGIDSTTVVCTMAKLLPQGFSTFTAGFGLENFEERQYARKSAEHFGVNHFEVSVDFSDTQYLPELLVHYGEPFADASCIPTYKVAKFASQSVKVLLGGDGGDELFGGYSTFLNLPNLSLTPNNALSHYFHNNSWIDRALRDSLYVEEWLRTLSSFDERLPDVPPTGGRLFDTDLSSLNTPSKIKLIELRSYLVDDILAKVDIASMKASVEVRSPLLDHRLVEWAFSLPYAMKIRSSKTKWIIREAFEKCFLAEILKLPKMGFGAPIQNWFRYFVEEGTAQILFDHRAKAKHIFSLDLIKHLMDEYQATGRRSYTLFILLVFEMWYREMTASIGREF